MQAKPASPIESADPGVGRTPVNRKLRVTCLAREGEMTVQTVGGRGVLLFFEPIDLQKAMSSCLWGLN